MTISLVLPYANAQPLEASPVAIYYGYPSLVNGAKGDLDKAAAVFNRYRIIVFGDGIELPGHTDHANVERLIPKLTNVRVFGYVCIGASQKLPLQQVRSRILAWQRLGANGVFLDEAGTDFGVGHAYREQVIDFVHGQGLSVFVNAFQPDDIFAEGSHLGKGDLYLLESFVVRMGELDNSVLMNARINRARKYRDRFQVGLVGITTTKSSFSQSLYQKACEAAAETRLEAFGWGEPWFSSQSNTLTQLSYCSASVQGAKESRTSASEKTLVAGFQR
jgi:hypothetical protein